MSDPDGETVDFGDRGAGAAEAESSGHAVHRAGHMEAPARVADEGADQDGAVRPSILHVEEG